MPARNLESVIEIAMTCVKPSEVKETMKNELMDLLAHRVMILGENATATDLFNDVFKESSQSQPHESQAMALMNRGAK